MVNCYYVCLIGESFLFSSERRNTNMKKIKYFDAELLSYARRMGCKTEFEFTLFLKARESIMSL